MNIAHYISNWWKEVLEYKERVLKDGGITKREDVVQRYYQMCKEQGILNSIKFAWLGEAGGKFRDSGANRFWTKAYSLVTPQAKYGPELVVDGGFDSNSWTMQTGWSISGGKALCNNVGISGLYRKVPTVVGKRYCISANVIVISGSCVLKMFDADDSPPITKSGFYSYILQENSPNTNAGVISGVSGFVGSIDDFSILEVLNSLDGSPTDATQTTSTNQPYLSGNIAPNEKWCLKNPNGGSSYMTHPTISFAANEAWSVTTVVNFSNSNGYYCGVLNGSGLLLSNGYLAFTNNSSTSQNVTIQRNDIVGKNTVLTITANGDGQINTYINGIFLQQCPLSSSFNFDSILRGRTNSFFGGISSHTIRSQALTPSQVSAEANFLRSLYPEIPSVTIGSQVWATSNCEMVATPQGNLIQNVTLSTNTEKITVAADRNFSSDTGFWTKTNVTISGGTANITSADGTTNSELIKLNMFTVGNWYRLQYDIVSNTAGSLHCASVGGTISSTVGTNKIVYFKALTTYINFQKVGVTNISLDNISVQEVGWSGSTDLYNAIYAQTTGTDEQKTYAAVKAAAMWRYPNNDSALGAIYNKKFNKYDLKLLAMDIAYYNTANPTTPWGYDVPTRSQLTTLAAIGGNAAKKDGTNYWTTANGTNSSGFTALGGGYIASNGITTNLKSSEYIGCKDADVAREIKDGDDTFNEVAIAEQGVSIRLIKN